MNLFAYPYRQIGLGLLLLAAILGLYTLGADTTWAGTPTQPVAQTPISSAAGANQIFLPLVANNLEEDTVEGTAATTLLDIRIATANDDAEQSLTSGVVYLNSSDLELGVDPNVTGNQIVGLRFTELMIPRNATIRNAHVTFEADMAGTNNAAVTIVGEATDYATAFTLDPFNLSARPKTAARITWSIPPWATNDSAQTPELAAILQEIVNRNGWSMGNSVVLLIEGAGTRTAESFEGEAASAPLLHISFTTAAGSPTPPPTFTPPPSPTPRPSSTAQPTATTSNSPTPPPPTATATPVPSGATARFAVIGDYGADSSAEADVAAMIETFNPQFIVTGGDNRYGSLSFDRAVGRHYCGYLANVPAGTYCPGGYAAINAFFPVLGNHDYGDSGGLNEYLNYFTLPGAGVNSSATSGNERYYDLIRGPVHFFMLDSDAAIDDFDDRAAQQAWLQSQLAVSTARWQIVLLHHAPYSSSDHGSHGALQWNYAAWGADAVIAAHDHTYERIQQNGIPYFVNGLGGMSIYGFDSPVAGSQVRYNNDYGAMIVNASETTLQFRFINRWGNEIDNYSVGTGTVPTATPTTSNPTPTPVVTPSATSPAGGAATVVTVRVNQSNDDVEEQADNGWLYANSSDLEMTEDGYTQIIGLRFRDVDVPHGSTVLRAYVEFTADETDSGPTTLAIHAEAADHAAAFGTSYFAVSSRPRTAAAATWQPEAWTVNNRYRTPDLAPVLNEVIGRAGWYRGNNLILVITGNGQRTAHAYDGDPAKAPLLYIEYQR